ncbi:hypothetical protein RDWZM_000812 [Blomia tropicalis]|uniref:Protein MCM10 homolog n=1 Tax=Blomia tropicalis TaxID=40697 RepID=A0A9Q0MD32_BLOTA|nr:hypothetical protein RDWZM_000812 [Blomia tropicalis]
MSYTAKELFGDFSDNEGFSDDEAGPMSSEGKQLFKKLSEQKCNINKNNTFSMNNSKSNKDTWKTKNSNVSNNNGKNDSKAIREVYSGINLINPLVSSDELSVLMRGRKMIKLSSLQTHINRKTNDVDDDWVTIGIVVNKQTKVSKNGNDYSLWKLSDLKSDKMVSLFLFGRTNEKHWKMAVGSVIGLLNATIMSDNNNGYKAKSSDIGSLTLDDPDKLLHIGTSKDMGYCKALKKNGEVCGSMIAKSEDEFCLYHIKNAYKKFSSKRAELQSNFANKEPEDFHFSNNFTPNIGLNQKNIVLKMQNINKKQLSVKESNENKKLQKVIKNPLSLAAQNMAVISKSGLTPGSGSSFVSKKKPTIPPKAQPTFKKFFEQQEKLFTTPSNSENDNKPILGKGLKRGQSVELKINRNDMEMSSAKRRAIEIFKNKPTPSPVIIAGSVTKAASTSSDGNKNKKLMDIMKRVNQSLKTSNNETKQEQLAEQKAAEEKKKFIEEAMNRKSINRSQYEALECDQKEKYFNVLEKKERYENRLAEVKELIVKVVTCTICNYTATSQGEVCQAKGHSVNFKQANKRFFTCRGCKARTFSFDSIMPNKACKQCGGTTYDRSAMIKDKIETKLGKDLLIRGEEVAFLNSLK